MDDLISRQAALDIVFDFAETPDKMYQQIRELPTIDPVKHGKWIKHGAARYRCGECGKIQNGDRGSDLHFCCNCGARMEGEEEWMT